MRTLFRAFEARRVRYLVISGQASVLYGAAHFSQDLDLWVEPARVNVRALIAALEDLRARIHKLTPPWTLRHMRRGHGFHFLVPQPGVSSMYLDVMGQPPRVGRFAPALRRARRLESPWGALPVVAIQDLVEIKKTNRPADYDVITRLALIRLAEEERPGPRLLRWALQNVFRAEDLWTVVRQFGPALRPSLLHASPEAALLHRVWRRGRAAGAAELRKAASLLSHRAQDLQDRGRAYWLPRIEELRQLRSGGQLLPTGEPVSLRLCPV